MVSAPFLLISADISPFRLQKEFLYKLLCYGFFDLWATLQNWTQNYTADSLECVLLCLS